MKKLVFAAVALVVLASLAGAAYRMGWLAKLPIPGFSKLAPASSATPGESGMASAPASPSPAAGAQPTTATAPAPAGAEGAAQSAPQAAAGGSTPPAAAPATDAKGEPLASPPPFDGNVASLDFGGTVESWSTDGMEWSDNQTAIAGLKGSRWIQYARQNPHPGELLVSFFAREPMLIDRVLVKRLPEYGPKKFPKDVEIWVSMAASPDEPFQKVATATLPDSVPDNGEATISFAPVEARFMKFRALNNQRDVQEFALAQLKVMEAQRPGYVPLITRHPELLWPGGPNRSVATPAAAGSGGCMPSAAEAPPSHPESRRVLLLCEGRGTHLAGALFERLTRQEELVLRQRPWFKLDPAKIARWEDDVPAEEKGVLTRAEYRFVAPEHARAVLFAPAQGYDTIVLAQMCNAHARMGALTPLFKQAMMAWVAAGHKLIIQDSDDCVPGPDYSFVPFKFKTDTPGARGAPGSDLRFVESNQMLQDRAGRPGFLDVKAWVADDRRRRYRNELGDANAFVQWDGNWCGQLAVRNVNNVLGFSVAYAHYGRGLIIYDGFDNDQNGESGYDEVAVRELAQPFDPDNLPCAARLGDFVLTTDTSLLQRGAVPGRTYTYPLTLLSNLGYTGTVNLSATPVGGISGLDTRFDPATVALTGEGRSGLSVTLPGSLPNPSFALEVKGADAAGKTNSLCLKFGPATSGELSVVSTLAPPTKTRKNLEIILDASGSMKTILTGQKTRWNVALETLDQVLRGLPDDSNVGLRIYGHREASTSPRTCTDSQLVVPIRKLDRNGILGAANRFKPKGETPLVYSALQSPADLKAVGGGTVILITDGEESCKGDTVKAAAELKASGLDIRLNIVGFALKNPTTQKQLAGFSQATGGLFYSADSGAALSDAVMLAAVEKFPYSVYDAAGKLVVAGEAGSGSDQLPAGDYKVVVKAGTKELVAPHVSVGPGQSVTLTIAMKNGQLVLQ